MLPSFALAKALNKSLEGISKDWWATKELNNNERIYEACQENISPVLDQYSWTEELAIEEKKAFSWALSFAIKHYRFLSESTSIKLPNKTYSKQKNNNNAAELIHIPNP